MAADDRDEKEDRMSLISKASRFARTPQGRQLFDKAQRMAKDPATRRKIAEARSRFGGARGKP
jgi:hypothetical protein